MPCRSLPLSLAVLPLVVLAGSTAAPSWAQASDAQIRVLLFEGQVLPLASLGRPLRLRAAGSDLLIPAGQALQARLSGGSVLLERGAESVALLRGRELWLEPAGPAQAAGGDAVARAQGSAGPEGSGAGSGADFQLQQRRFRGRLQLLASGGGLQAINHLSIEHYLPAVVGSEMPASWPQAALRAQAVAARTYALRQRKPAAAYDVTATVSSQVYKGVEAETASTREAVAATRGQVLMFEGSLANAVFHSSSGDSTEASGEIWSRQLPYLVSVPDFDEHSPVRQWQQRLEPQDLRRAFGEIGGANRIDILATSGSGRVKQARVVGPSGTLVLSGAQLRSRLGLRSTHVRFQWLEPVLASSQLGGSPLAGAQLGAGLTGADQQEAGQQKAGQQQAVAGAAAAARSGASQPLASRLAASQPSATQSGAFLAAASLQPPPPLPAIEPRQPLRLPQPSLLVIGKGFGHGVGMSQWGAYSLARRGESYERILSHYYRGTQLRSYAAP